MASNAQNWKPVAVRYKYLYHGTHHPPKGPFRPKSREHVYVSIDPKEALMHGPKVVVLDRAALRSSGVKFQTDPKDLSGGALWKLTATSFRSKQALPRKSIVGVFDAETPSGYRSLEKLGQRLGGKAGQYRADRLTALKRRYPDSWRVVLSDLRRSGLEPREAMRF